MRPVLALLCLSVLSVQAQATERSLDRWFDRELVPYVTSQLVEHPRFKGESVMFVVFEDNVPASVSNALAISLRDRLLDAALNAPGVIVGRRQGGAAAGMPDIEVKCVDADGKEAPRVLPPRPWIAPATRCITTSAFHYHAGSTARTASAFAHSTSRTTPGCRVSELPGRGR